MDKPKQINIAQKLKLSFSILVLMFVLFGLFVLYGMHTVSGLAHSIYNHPLVVSNAALQSNISIMKMNLNMHNVVLLNSQSEINRTIKAINEQERQVYKYLDMIKEAITGNEGKMLGDEVRIVFGNWRPIREEVFEPVSRGEKEIAAGIVIGKGARHVALLETKIFGLITYARKKASDFIHEANKAHLRMDVALVSFLLLGFLISGLVVFFTLKWTASTEGALRANEFKYRSLVESIPQKIFLKDRDLIYISCNRSYAEDLDIDPNEISGKDDFMFYPRELAQKYRADDKKIMAAGKTETLEERYVTKGEERWVRTTKVPFSREDGEPYAIFGIFEDITEHKQAEEELKNTQARILQSEKMASIGQLAAGVAHEINNPTGFVSSNLRTLADYIKDISGLSKEYRKLLAELKQNSAPDGGLPDVSGQVKRITDLEEEVDIDFLLNDISELIEESRDGTERIKKIVQDLKDFAHPGEDKLKFADINKNLDSTVNVVWNELKYKAEVTKDYGDLPEVQCYPHLLNQVFVNILVNAAQSIKERGKIGIKSRADNGYVEIKISDTGSGIPKENLARIFDPFFTTKEVGKGTGLGMNVAYNIVKKHKGTIGVESTAGEGTTFTIRIPME